MALLRQSPPLGRTNGLKFGPPQCRNWRVRSLVGAVLAVAFALLGPDRLEAQAFHEKEVQSVFLFNFAQYVEWSSSAFADQASPIILGVLGNDVIYPHLETVAANESVRGRPLLVKSFRRLQDIDVCHILFISPGVGDLEPILRTLQGRNTLTVSDLPRFAERGGMIQFQNQRNRIRLRINLAAVRMTEITVSSKLLRVAEIVGPAP